MIALDVANLLEVIGSPHLDFENSLALAWFGGSWCNLEVLLDLDLFRLEFGNLLFGI